LGWDIVPSYLCYIPARYRLNQSDVWSATTTHRLSSLLHSRNDSLRSVERFHHDVDRSLHPGCWRRRHHYLDAYVTHSYNSHVGQTLTLELFRGHLLRHRTPKAAPKVLPVGTWCLVRGVHHWSRYWRCSYRTCIMAMVLPHQLPLLWHRPDCSSLIRSSEQSGGAHAFPEAEAD
jgi:hypothetical protein